MLAIVEGMIRAQVGGDPARIRRPLVSRRDREEGSDAPSPAFVEISMIRESSFTADLGLVIAHGEQLTGRTFEVFRADTGRPGHFTLACSLPRAPVLFHAGQVGYAGYLSAVAWCHILDDENLDVEDHTRRICLRLLADHLLCLGQPRAAISALARARTGLPSHALFEGFRQRMPPSDAAAFEAASYSPEHYFPLAFQGLAHEFGHHVSGDLRGRIEAHRLLEAASLADAIRQNIEFFEAGRGAVPVPSDLEGHEDEAIAMMLREIEDLARRGSKALREEIIADLAALPMLWKACLDAAVPLARNPFVSCHIFAAQAVLAQVALMITYVVGLMARRFDTSPLTPSEFVEALIGITTRMRVVSEVLLRDGGDLGWLGIDARTGEGEGVQLLTAALPLCERFMRGALAADECVKASDFMTETLVRNFVEDAANLTPLSGDTSAFLKLADDLQLRSPELDRMRERRPDPALFD
jgi:hypothetical protein